MDSVGGERKEGVRARKRERGRGRKQQVCVGVCGGGKVQVRRPSIRRLLFLTTAADEGVSWLAGNSCGDGNDANTQTQTQTNTNTNARLDRKTAARHKNRGFILKLNTLASSCNVCVCCA